MLSTYTLYSLHTDHATVLSKQDLMSILGIKRMVGQIV